ncbi:MAG: glycosyltransferase family A protein [Acidobacteriota bacterium]|nr:glycosyltransferase family A protein [Acidobacteriota bacterium]
MSDTLTASVVITTKNRRDELRAALRSAVEQTATPEVLVIDDGSSDGTPEMVTAEFPGVRLVRHDDSLGYIVRRNEGARLATGAIVCSIDDDAAFSTPDVVRQALGDFASERIAAVAIPYIDIHTDPRVCQAAPDAQTVYVTDRYKGTAYAVRRDVFVRLGGYREHLFHQGEEGDFCIRLLAAGYVVRLGNAAPIHHAESPKRDFQRMDFYGVRNAVLFAWQNVPAPLVLIHLPVVVLRCLAHTWNPGRLRTRIAGVLTGIRLFASVPREPVPAWTYRLWRALAKGPQPLSRLRRWPADA